MTTRIHFTGVVQAAQDFLFEYILKNPRQTWPRTYWMNFEWSFDDIFVDDEVVLGPDEFNSERLAVTRVVRFRLGNDDVVKLTMFGTRLIKPYEGQRFPQWTVKHVWYRVNWHSGGPEDEVIEHELIASCLSGTRAED
jgi:hypothetical protein